MSTETKRVAPTLRGGDVVRYTPHTTWCRDGYAIAEQQTDRVVLVDTYWSGCEGVVAPDTYEVLFNLADYDEKPHGEYETFAPADRQFIPRHHHHRPLYLVRKGAEPDLATQIVNAELSLAAAEDELRSAQWWVERRCEDLAALRDRKAAVTQ